MPEQYDGFIQTCLRCNDGWYIPFSANSYGSCPHCGFDYDKLSDMIRAELKRREVESK
jgi:hypothetical protein